MKIYVSHVRDFNYKDNLYIPLRASSLNLQHELILPHENSEESHDTKALFDTGCDLVLAEVSYPSTGQGIELGWASDRNIPIVCMYKKGQTISGSLKLITGDFIQYEDSHDMLEVLEAFLTNRF